MLAPKQSCQGGADCCCAGKPKLPDGFEADTWAKLQDAVHAVHAKRPVSCSLEGLYRVRWAQCSVCVASLSVRGACLLSRLRTGQAALARSPHPRAQSVCARQLLQGQIAGRWDTDLLHTYCMSLPGLRAGSSAAGLLPVVPSGSAAEHTVKATSQLARH